MRILVLQLARFGDIYQTWPTLSALQRKFPGAELHVLVRSRFQDALASFTGIIPHILPTHEILRPILESSLGEGGEHEAIERILAAIEPLSRAPLDLIINLSYSPMSSYLTDLLSSPRTQVCGYTRHDDGYLHIPDDTSAYFYAQVGVGRSNRYHITEIFAACADVSLEEADFALRHVQTGDERHGIVIHLGASTPDKAYPPELWVEVLRTLLNETCEPITLIGSAGERKLADTVVRHVAEGRSEFHLTNLVGETSLVQLEKILFNSKLLIGADSAPVHIASLTSTRVLNLSGPHVNFWETGPLTPHSRILYVSALASLRPQTVAEEALGMLEGRPPRNPCAIRETRLDPYRLHELPSDPFAWDLILAMYTNSPYPSAETSVDRLAFHRLYELAELALHQMDQWMNVKTRGTAAHILSQIDSMLTDVAGLNPRVAPVVRWFETQRLRIPPGFETDTLDRTRSAFQDLLWVCRVYRPTTLKVNEGLQKAVDLCQTCIPDLREYNLNGAQAGFQSLMGTLQELARDSTKVEVLGPVLEGLHVALEKHDFIEVADLLQWKLIPALETQLDKDVLS